MKVQLMHVSQQKTHRLLRTALERVMTFSEMYESDSDTEILYAELAAAYFQERPMTMLWVGLDDGGKVVAHLFATIDNYYGGRFVTIHQCWKDPDVKDFTLDEKKELVEAVKTFGRPFGCTDVRTFAINSTIGDILETYGFERTGREMLKVPIEERKEN